MIVNPMNGLISCLACLLFFSSATASAERLTCEWPHGMPTPGILLVGEVHGTNEAPEFVASLACSTLEAKMNVVVALEIPHSQQPLIDAYLTSSGSARDKSTFLSGSFWTKRTQDGRSSMAMFKLIEELRRLKKRMGGVHIVAVDEAIDSSRDAGMATHIRRAASYPNARVIALLGNYHASQKRGASWDSEYEPAGYRLSSLGPHSVLFSTRGGSAWVCSQRCGVQQVGSLDAVDDTLGYTDGLDIRPGFNGVYRVSASTASPPAAAQKK